MRDSEFLTWPEMKAQMHYLAWLLFSLISFPAGGHAAVLLLCVSIGEYVEQDRLLITVVAAAIMTRLAYTWRKFGERHCRFAEFDGILDRCFQPTGETSHAAKIDSLIAAIENSHGMERQLARNEAKRWLQSHAPELSAEDRETVSAHLGYLWKH